MVSKEQVGNFLRKDTIQKILGTIAIIFVVLTLAIAVNPQSFLGMGYIGIFFFNFFSSSLLLIPLLLEEYSVAGIIITSALGNIFNTSINYFVGYSSTSILSDNPLVGKLKHMINKYGLIMVFILSVIPMPLDLNGLLSGYAGISYRKYVMVNFLGKCAIFALVALGVITIPNFIKFQLH